MKEYWKILGSFSKHQWFFIIGYCLLNFMQACETFAPTFIAILPQFYCEDWLPQSFNRSLRHFTNNNSLLGQCSNNNNSANNKTCPTNKWRFDDSLRSETLYSEYGLACENSYLVPMGTSVYMAGLLLGSFAVGYFSDRYGRYPCIVLCMTMTAIAAFILPFLPSYWMFVIARFVLALFMSGSWVVVSSYIVELTTPNKRMILGLMARTFGWDLGALIGVFAAYFIRGYRLLLLVYGSLAVLNLWPVIFYLESPLWLLSVGQRKKAAKVTQKIAKRNGKSLTEDEVNSLLDMVEVNSQKQDKTTSENVKVGIWKLFTSYPRLRLILFINWIHFFASSMIYYAISLGASSLGGNLYLNTMFMYLGDIIILLPVYYWVKVFPRRYSLLICYAMGSVLCILSSVFFYYSASTGNSTIQTLVIVTSLFGRYMFSFAFLFNWVYVSEIFPTIVRSTAVGSSSAMARIGGILAPLIMQLSSTWSPLPFLVFALISGICAFTCIWLPETCGRPCVQHLDDGERQ